MKGPVFRFRSKVWLYSGMAAWHFISISKSHSKKIKQLFGDTGKGFGSVPVIVTIGKTNWKTSIFPDKKTATYVLPLKSEIRKKEKIKAGDMVPATIEVRIDMI